MPLAALALLALATLTAPPDPAQDADADASAADEEEPLAVDSIPHHHRPFTVDTPGGGTLTFSGYIETYYGYNFNRPSNNLTNTIRLS